MQQRARKFEVTTVDANGVTSVSQLWAETPQLAVGMVECDVPEGTAIGYRMSVEIVGKCGRCRCLIEVGQKFHVRGTSKICTECHR